MPTTVVFHYYLKELFYLNLVATHSMLDQMNNFVNLPLKTDTKTFRRKLKETLHTV